MLFALPEEAYAPIEQFTENGIVNLGVGVTLLILANALSYLIVKSFNIPSYYGRFLGGIIIMFIVLMLSLSTEYVNRFRSALLFGIGEVIIGALDIINNKISSSQPLLIPDPGCSGGSSGGGG
jgi:hypothetical protein